LVNSKYFRTFAPQLTIKVIKIMWLGTLVVSVIAYFAYQVIYNSDKLKEVEE
jgi:hypothetical protein